MNRKNNRSKISYEAILAISTQLFSQKGYKGTSLRDISSRLKVSRPALYYYFKNKMEILKNLHSKAFEELVSSSEEKMNPDLPIDVKFKLLVENQVNVVAKNVELVRIFFGDEKEFPRNVIREMRQKRKAYAEKLIQLYKEGVKEGLFRDIDPKIAVYTIMGACNWIQMWYSRGGELKENELAKVVSDLLCMGYFTNTSRNKNGG